MKRRQGVGCGCLVSLENGLQQSHRKQPHTKTKNSGDLFCKLGSMTPTLILIQLLFWSPVILEAEDYSSPAAWLAPVSRRGGCGPSADSSSCSVNVVAADKEEM